MSTQSTRTPPTSTPEKAAPPSNKSPPTTPNQSQGNAGTQDSTDFLDQFIDNFDTPDSPSAGGSQKTPAKKKKRVGWAGKTKGYSYKVSKQGKSKGTGPAKASSAAPRRVYKHTELPDIAAGDLATTRSTRSAKGEQTFHALPYPK
ncbi:hypothetical protein CLAFUW4_06110 [Fulvia fulva]|uniref:Uncharacterized protein n=1 Tax=Passalora fulva TaxID=5499 RepID=A0A9Q8LH90_PASFU|nr:uncharacterized protein CLAFUR5_06254 [Fulvia fulva]KAK4624034.1 hypothetical protein CLAFUR4_06114 [Fulvia fulva]KAK4625515.1 hypothetical protein CLAFUR0_06118 [Fulvia fulva]UJO17450.1 hypothetical protein CLAFUR5_06254 [Fulvia fulva]WPV14771.1 hypothetical protein CLAFUW4_06110 [Fulvia fulva]WPV30244.1 hypothetical protein CLAFUW7_06107 [Fulvia fulva]